MDTQLSQMIIEIMGMNGKVVSKGIYAGISNKIGINTSIWDNGSHFTIERYFWEQDRFLSNYKTRLNH